MAGSEREDEALVVAKASRKASAMIAATTAKGRLAGFLDHVPSPPRERPLALPAADLLGAHENVMAAVATGEISIGDAQAYAALLECTSIPLMVL